MLQYSTPYVGETNSIRSVYINDMNNLLMKTKKWDRIAFIMRHRTTQVISLSCTLFEIKSICHAHLPVTFNVRLVSSDDVLFFAVSLYTP